MCRVDPDHDRITRKQSAMFRLADRDYRLSQIDISEETGTHKNSIGNYARGESIMGFSAFYKLCHTIPLHLLSIMLPAGFQIHRVPEGVDHASVARLIENQIDKLLEEAGE